MFFVLIVAENRFFCSDLLFTISVFVFLYNVSYHNFPVWKRQIRHILASNKNLVLRTGLQYQLDAIRIKFAKQIVKQNTNLIRSMLLQKTNNEDFEAE